MSERRRLHPVLAVSVLAVSALAVMGAAIVTACGAADLATTRSAGMTVATEPSAYTPGQLRAALLPEVGPPARPPPPRPATTRRCRTCGPAGRRWRASR